MDCMDTLAANIGFQLLREKRAAPQSTSSAGDLADRGTWREQRGAKTGEPVPYRQRQQGRFRDALGRAFLSESSSIVTATFGQFPDTNSWLRRCRSTWREVSNHGIVLRSSRCRLRTMLLDIQSCCPNLSRTFTVTPTIVPIAAGAAGPSVAGQGC